LVEVEPYQYARKWVCIDYCGHVEEYTQMIYLIDSEKPQLTVQDVAISFASAAEVTLSVEDVIIEAVDNCDSELELAMSQSLFLCEDFLDHPEQLIEITATDDQGNVTVEQLIVSLSGGLFLMECPDDMSVTIGPGACSATVTYQIAPQGLCNQVPQVEQIDGTGLTSGDAFPIGKTPQVYRITDQLGYAMECAFF